VDEEGVPVTSCETVRELDGVLVAVGFDDTERVTVGFEEMLSDMV
jgi:hypothetical protein